MMQDMCILVVSCDKYVDCWTPFSDCMRKFWSDCPYPVYLCTESGEPENGAVYSKVFHEQTQIWTARVRKACEKIKESHILIVLEDQWPSLPVSTATVQNILGLMQSQENIGIVYLDKEVHGMPLWQQNSHFYLLPPETPYRMSVVPAIWDRDFLLTAFHEDLSAWDFERVGSFEKSTYSKTVLVTVDRVFARVCETGAVMQGKWLRGVAAFAKENNLKIDFSKRETLSSKDLFLKDCKSFVYNLNPALIVKIQNWLYHHSQKK